MAERMGFDVFAQRSPHVTWRNFRNLLAQRMPECSERGSLFINWSTGETGQNGARGRRSAGLPGTHASSAVRPSETTPAGALPFACEARIQLKIPAGEIHGERRGGRFLPAHPAGGFAQYVVISPSQNSLSARRADRDAQTPSGIADGAVDHRKQARAIANTVITRNIGENAQE
jgi:hypothetical protein